MKFETLILKKEEGVATIVLNRPEVLNAINQKMREELITIVDVVRSDDVKVVVFTGAGRAFCSGGDVRAQRSKVESYDPVKRRDDLRLGNDLILGITKLEKPVIASVNGVAAGAGFNLALACDIRIVSEKARFSAVFVKAGLHPDTGASYFLPRLLGTARACEFIFTGKVIDAEEAEKIGLVNRVVMADELEKTTKDLAIEISKGPSIPIRMAKHIIYKGMSMDLVSVLEYETLAQVLCVQTEDHKEGVKAFLERREPIFRGV